MSLVPILKSRAEALLRRFNDENMPPLVAAPNLAEPGLQHVYSGGKLGPIAGFGATDAMVWRFPDNDRSSLWVRQDFKAYREAYLAFVKQVYGVGGTLPAGYDVDHIHNKARAPTAYWIRVEAVESRSNRSHGAGFEKRYGGSPITEARVAAGVKPILMNFVSALKLAGVLSPMISDNAASRARHTEIVEFFTQRGWSRQTVEQALDALAEAADRR